MRVLLFCFTEHACNMPLMAQVYSFEFAFQPPAGLLKSMSKEVWQKLVSRQLRLSHWSNFEISLQWKEPGPQTNGHSWWTSVWSSTVNIHQHQQGQKSVASNLIGNWPCRFKRIVWLHYCLQSHNSSTGGNKWETFALISGTTQKW